jgi:hypothetical protein
MSSGEVFRVRFKRNSQMLQTIMRIAIIQIHQGMLGDGRRWLTSGMSGKSSVGVVSSMNVSVAKKGGLFQRPRLLMRRLRSA